MTELNSWKEIVQAELKRESMTADERQYLLDDENVVLWKDELLTIRDNCNLKLSKLKADFECKRSELLSDGCTDREIHKAESEYAQLKHGSKYVLILVDKRIRNCRRRMNELGIEEPERLTLSRIRIVVREEFIKIMQEAKEAKVQGVVDGK